MKRSFLEALGIEKDVIDKILDENGTEVSALNARIKAKDTEIATLRGDLTQANTDLAAVRNENAQLKKEDVETIKAELQAEKDGRAKDRVSYEFTNALIQNGCTDTEYIRYKVGDNLTLDDKGKIKDIDNIIKDAKEKYSSFFNGVSNGGTGSTGNFAREHAGKTPATANPWTAEGWNVTKQYALEIQNPERAKQLQLEAGFTED